MVIPISADLLKALHESVLEDDPKAARGYRHESMIACCAERTVRTYYGYDPYHDIVERAGGLMFSINTFHPFTDCCKRTSLLATYFFLLFNGYTFDLNQHMVDLTVKIADRKITEESEVTARIRPFCRRNLILVLYCKFLFSNINSDFLKSQLFFANFVMPLIEKTKRIWPKA